MEGFGIDKNSGWFICGYPSAQYQQESILKCLKRLILWRTEIKKLDEIVNQGEDPHIIIKELADHQEVFVQRCGHASSSRINAAVRREDSPSRIIQPLFLTRGYQEDYASRGALSCGVWRSQR